MKILVAYDGTLHAKKAISYGIEKVGSAGGEITVLQIFDRSLFIDYDAGPAAEEMARREASGHLMEAKRIISEMAAGIKVTVVSAEGGALGILREHAAKELPDLLLVPPRFKAAVGAIPCPVFLVPGTILVPVDMSGSTVGVERIIREAQGTGAEILLLGIVPIHLFGQEEKRELTQVKRGTETVLKQLMHDLQERGVKTRALLRSGYPDEEILKVAEEYRVSLILLPAGGTTPSELSKAAAILTDEPGRLPWPVFLVPETGMA